MVEFWRRQNKVFDQANVCVDSRTLMRCKWNMHQARDPANLSATNLLKKFTIASFSNAEVVQRASKLGVSLGKSPSQIDESIKNLEDIDVTHTLFMLNRNEEKALLG
jgi:hypothetical protein